MSDTRAAIAAWSDLLGADAVRTGPDLVDYLANVTGHERAVPAVLRVRDRASVPAIVAIAREHGVPLHPISTGRNWGLGSRLPVRDGTVVVDLGGLDRVIAVDRTTGTVTIEPGVTQGVLADHLDEHAPDLIYNMTGSAADTSIVGNALDHGIGYLAPRAEDVVGIEVVLGNGRTLRVGEWPTPGAHHGPHWHHGIGPALHSLFQQSNLGIVTGMSLRLRTRPEATSAFRASVARDEQIVELLDRLAGLRRDDALTAPVRVFDGVWMTGKQDDDPAWTAFGGVRGRAAVVAAQREAIDDDLSALASVQFASVDRGERPADTELSWWRSVVSVMNGRPTNLSVTNWATRIGVTFSTIEDLDTSDFGMLCDVRAIPFDGEKAYEAVTLARKVCADHGYQPCVSLSALDGYTLEAVFIVLFNRAERERADQAHRAFDALTSALTAAGLVPHRVGVDKMAGFVDADTDYWATAAAIKEVMDPDLVIAPGRYNPH